MKKQIHFWILLFCCFMIIPKVQAANYEILSFDYQATISKDYKSSVEEQYSVYTIEGFKSFERNILLKQQIIKRDGTKTVQATKIGPITISDFDYMLYPKRNEKTIVINHEVKANESSNFNISYQRDLGKVIRNTQDELFLSIVDGTFQTTVSNVNFVITLPEEIVQDTLQFYVNGVVTPDVSYQISGKTIIGHLNDLLEENETFSLSMTLPKGYFTKAQITSNNSYPWVLLFPIISLIFGIYAYLRYQYKNEIHIEQSFLPPKDFDSAELSFLYRGYTRKCDIVSILIFLANRGYIRFISTQNVFALEKIKDYDGKNALQKSLFDGLFHNRDIVRYSELKYYLSCHENDLKKIIDNQENRVKIFEKNYKRVYFISCLFIGISAFLLMSSSIYSVFSNILYACISGILFWFGLHFALIRDSGKIEKGLGIITLVVTIGIGGYLLYSDALYFVLYIVGILTLILTSCLIKYISERTRFGNSILGQIAGFRNTLYNMSVTTLKEKQEENSNYFYQMIPYVYTFGFFDKWVMNGYQVVSKLPVWYQDDQCHSLKTFRQTLQNFLLGLERDNDIPVSESKLQIVRPKIYTDLDEK